MHFANWKQAKQVSGRETAEIFHPPLTPLRKRDSVAKSNFLSVVLLMNTVKSHLRTNNTTPVKRLPQLDLLRAFAILIVLLAHAPCSLDGLPQWFQLAYGVIIQGGWVGVDLFFVLSGFLISSLLFKEQLQYGTISFKRFFLRRGLKIYPSFYFLFALTIAVYFVTGTHPGLSMKPRTLVDELIFLQNYGPYLWYHCWSLAIEEHFYILLPLALILAIKWNSNKHQPFLLLPQIFLVVGTGVLLLRIFILLFGVRLRPGRARCGQGGLCAGGARRQRLRTCHGQEPG